MPAANYVIIDHGNSSMVLNLTGQTVEKCKSDIAWQVKGGAARSSMHICQWDADLQSFISQDEKEFRPSQSPFTDEAWAKFSESLAPRPVVTDVRYMAVLREFERGWGQKDFHAVKFDDYERAKRYVKRVNAKNTEPTAPDYYIQARIITDPEEFSYYEKFC